MGFNVNTLFPTLSSVLVRCPEGGTPGGGTYLSSSYMEVPPRGAAHTYIAHIWEYPPGGGTYLYSSYMGVPPPGAAHTYIAHIWEYPPGAAHTYIAHIWENPPPGVRCHKKTVKRRTKVVTNVMKSISCRWLKSRVHSTE